MRWKTSWSAFAARGGDFADGYNIIVPAWELPEIPRCLAKHLRRFDEVWALSRFIQGSLNAAGIPSHPSSARRWRWPLGHFLPRKYFGIRELAFTLLHFFDMTFLRGPQEPGRRASDDERFAPAARSRTSSLC